MYGGVRERASGQADSYPAFFHNLFSGRQVVLLGEKLGLSADAMIGAFNQGDARRYVTEIRVPKFILTGKFDMRVPFITACKDISLARKLRKTIK